MALVLVAAALMALTPLWAQASGPTAEERRAAILLLDKINSWRDAHAKKHLNDDSFLDSLAVQHSYAMARRHDLSHFGFQQRFDEERAKDPSVNWMCENVAYASGYSTMKSAVGALYQAWVDSPPHRKCMFDLEGHTTSKAGVGIRHVGSTYWATFDAAGT